MIPRKIKHVSSAQILKQGPYEKKKLTGARELGMAFERKINTYTRRLLPKGKHYYDFWIQFEAEGKKGWAQPDKWIVFDDCVLVIEAKLSQKRSAIPQLTKLYMPLLQHLYPNKEIIMVHAFKNKKSRFKTIDTLLDAFSLPRNLRREVLFYHHVH